MSLKNWIKLVESERVEEATVPPGSIAIPSLSGQGNVAPALLKIQGNDPTLQNVLKQAAMDKKLVSVGTVPTGSAAPAGQTPAQKPAQGATMSTMQTASTAQPVKEDDLAEVAPPGMEDTVLALKKKFPGQEGRAYAIAWSQYNKKHGKKEVDEGNKENKQKKNEYVSSIIQKKLHPSVLHSLKYGRQELKKQEMSEDEHDGRMKKELEKEKSRTSKKPMDDYERKVVDYLKKKYDKKEESMYESVSTNKKSIMEGTLEEILANHPHEHRMCQEGWGMDVSLYEALCDHYFKEGKIPRSVWHGSAEDLRRHVEECYAQDTGMVLGEGEMEEGLGGALVGGALGAAAGPIGGVIGSAIGSDLQDTIDEESSLERDIRDAAMRSVKDEMDESHQADDLPQDTLDLIDEYIAKFDPTQDRDEMIRDIMTGAIDTSELEWALQDEMDEDMFESKFTKLSKKLSKQPGVTDPDALAASIGRKKLGQAEMTRRSKAAKADESIEEGMMDKLKTAGKAVKKAVGKAVDKIAPGDEDLLKDLQKKVGVKQTGKKPEGVKEAVTQTKTGRVHHAEPGGYGRKDDEDEEGKKVVATVKRGRGRPKKGGDETGEVKKYDWSGFGVGGKDVKLPKWDKSKTTKHKIKDSAEPKDEMMENWDKQLKSLLKEGTEVAVAPMAKPMVKPAVAHDDGSSDALAAIKALLGGSAMTTDTAAIEEPADLESHGIPSPTMATIQSGVNMPVNDKESEPGLNDPRNNPIDGQIFVPQLAMPRGMGMSVEGDVHAHHIDVDPAAPDEVINALAAGEGEQAAQDDGTAALDFIKRLISDRNGTGEAKLIVPAMDYEPETDDSEVADADGDTFGHSTDAIDSEAAEIAEDDEGDTAAFGDDAEINASLAQSYDADKDVNQDKNVSIDEEALDQPGTFEGKDAEKMCECGSGVYEAKCDHQTNEGTLFSKLLKMFEAAKPDYIDLDKDGDKKETMKKAAADKEKDEKEEVDESTDVTDFNPKSQGGTRKELLAKYHKSGDPKDAAAARKAGATQQELKGEKTKVDEWANTPNGGSKDESFQTDIDFMTKFISGGLNNMKQDQTTVPSARVVTKSETNNPELSMAAQLKKLAGLN